MSTKSKEVSTLDDVPEYLKQGDKPEYGADELAIPRMSLVQAMTPQRNKTNANYIKGLEEGQFFNTITEENYGEEVEAVVLKNYRSRIKFFPRASDKDGVECASQDGKTGGTLYPTCEECPHKNWGDNNEPPACGVAENFLLAINGAPVLYNLRSSALREAKTWKTQLQLAGVAWYGVKWLLKSVSKKKGTDTYFGMRVSRNGYVTEEEAVVYKKMFDNFKTVNIGGGTDDKVTTVAATDKF